MSEWRTEFQYLLDRKILNSAELGYLFGQIKSIIDRETADLQAQLAKHRWIPVSERPEENGYYLVSEEDGRFRELWFDIQKGWCFGNRRIYIFDKDITHWKPITLPDKEKSDE